MAFVIELFLPLRDRDGARQPAKVFDDLKQRLVDRFGGVTVFARAPAEGLWSDGEVVERDEIVVFEVMAETLEGDWWSNLRGELEKALRQDEVIIRAAETRRL